jgi:hypothetical protein
MPTIFFDLGGTTRLMAVHPMHLAGQASPQVS